MRLGEHRRDTLNGRLDKAVAKHFSDIKSTVNDLIFVPLKIKSNDRNAFKHLENKAINDFNMIEAGVIRILA